MLLLASPSLVPFYYNPGVDEGAAPDANFKSDWRSELKWFQS
jgi:hypothetical protein